MKQIIKVEKVEVNVNQYQIETKCRTQENEEETKGLLKLVSDSWKYFINRLRNWY